MALLDAAKAEGRAEVGRVLLGVLAGTGLRIEEALSLRWRHVDLATGTLYVTDSKTAAGVRQVDLTAALRGELKLWKHDSTFVGPDDYVLPTSTGRKHHPSSLRRDVLRPAVERADVELAKDGIAPIEHSTFHSMRRTYASLRGACGDDIRYTSSQIGHEDVRFTMRVYAQAVTRRDRLTGAHARAYDRAIEWARIGTNADLTVEALQTEATKNPALAGLC